MRWRWGHLNRRGAVLILSMIFLAVFSVLAVSLVALSNANTQIADNLVNAKRARACAESGLDVIRYWLAQTTIPGSTADEDRLQALATALQTELSADAVSQITASYTSPNLVIPRVYLDDAHTESFSAVLTSVDPNLCLEVQGYYGSIQRTIQVQFRFGTRANTVFDFGVATKGPLKMQGSVEIDDVNVSVTSNTYIESMYNVNALDIQNAGVSIDGGVMIANPFAIPLVHSKATIGGESGAGALNHIQIGVPPSEFPQPNPAIFRPYATQELTAVTDKHGHTSYTYNSDTALENIHVPADCNPTFNGHATIKGVLFIEPSNIVTFTGGATVTGIIVGNGSWTDDSYTDKIVFRGNTECNSVSVSTLTGPQFAGLKDKTGTFIVAPGFYLDFSGNFKCVAGTIAANGINLLGNAGLTIQGSVINYANKEMLVGGNGAIHLNRSGLTAIPAGFANDITLSYDPESYREQ